MAVNSRKLGLSEERDLNDRVSLVLAVYMQAS
jgi:hypothetical protein